MIKINKKFLTLCSILYIYIPIEIFLFGWTKWYIAILATAVFVYFLNKMYRDFCSDRLTSEDERNLLQIKIPVFIVILLFLIAIGYYAGWGNFVDQMGDWSKHNTILSDLVERSWPVYYQNEGEHSMLTYYIGQYLVPALIGKLFHSFRVAEIMNYIWAECGLILVALNMLRVLKLRSWYSQVLASVGFIFFACPLPLAQAVRDYFYPFVTNYRPTGSTMWFHADFVIMLQYGSGMSYLQWVYAQVIVTWLIMLLFYEHRDQIKHYCMMLLPGIIFAVLPFLGIAVMAACYAICCLLQHRNFKCWLKEIFSISNILSAVLFVLIFGSYYMGNVLGEKPAGVGFSLMPYAAENAMPLYYIFVTVMVLLYAVLIFADHKKDPLFYISTAVLLILPLLRMGLYNDLTMRSSIPALFVYNLMIYQYIAENGKQFLMHIADKKEKRLGLWKMISCLLLLILLWNSAAYPAKDLKDAIASDDIHTLGETRTYGTMEIFANRSLSLEQDDRFTPDNIYNYFTYDIDSNFFYKYIARKK